MQETMTVHSPETFSKTSYDVMDKISLLVVMIARIVERFVPVRVFFTASGQGFETFGRIETLHHPSGC